MVGGAVVVVVVVVVVVDSGTVVVAGDALVVVDPTTTGSVVVEELSPHPARTAARRAIATRAFIDESYYSIAVNWFGSVRKTPGKAQGFSNAT